MNLDVSQFDHYILAAALRGPDCSDAGAHDLKVLTTGVLRYYLNAEFGVSATPLEAQTYWDALHDVAKGRARGLFVQEYHFSRHWRDAFDILTNPEKSPLSHALRAEAQQYYAWIIKQL